MAQGNLQPEQIKAIREIGGKVKDLEVRGEPIPDELQQQWEPLAPVAGFVKNAVRRAPARGGHRRGADRAGDPRVLLGLRHPGARGLRHDRDLDGGDDLVARRSTSSAPSARRCRAWRSRSPRTARSSSRARTSSRATTRTPTRRSAPSRTAGCTRATSGRSTRTATSRSPAARRTSSSPRAART